MVLADIWWVLVAFLVWLGRTLGIALNRLSRCGFGISVNCKHAVADFRLSWILKPLNPIFITNITKKSF